MQNIMGRDYDIGERDHDFTYRGEPTFGVEDREVSLIED
jgi:hypothetical protein